MEVIQKEKKMPVKVRYCKFAVGLLLKFNLQEIQVVPWLLKVAQDRWKLLELQAGDVDVQENNCQEFTQKSLITWDGKI